MTSKFCPNCGTEVVKPGADVKLMSDSPQSAAWAPGAVFALAALSAFIPIAGVLIGLYAYGQPAKRHQAGTMFVWAAIGLVVTLLLLGAI